MNVQEVEDIGVSMAISSIVLMIKDVKYRSDTIFGHTQLYGYTCNWSDRRSSTGRIAHIGWNISCGEEVVWGPTSLPITSRSQIFHDLCL